MISVHTTVPDEETAKRMARELVGERIAACVNYHAVSSVYRWEGDVIEEEEYALDVKTALEYDEVRAEIEEKHPYDLPAILRVETEANDGYDEWVEDCSK
ncbi:MAG: divalent-cation tolerance protein CutA [Halobacteriales archaeon]|nr:divalent-cation tolerance protein CutA [Halobacteriales archaeon]